MNILPPIEKLFEAQTSEREQFVELLQMKSAKLEHIVSNGVASAAGFWYDQAQEEWVALIRGSAVLQFENGSLNLIAGDALTIPAHLKHRGAAVSQDAIWLALHYNPLDSKL